MSKPCPIGYRVDTLPPTDYRCTLASGHNGPCERVQVDPNPGETHYPGCWKDGPKHYGCAVERVKELEAQLDDRFNRVCDAVEADMSPGSAEGEEA